MKKTFSWAILSSFILKIIAMVTMTVDHVGVVLANNVGYNYLPSIICRYVGRLALPLFCFMIVEGVLNTKKFSRYVLRLGIMATLILGAFVFIEYVPIFDGLSMRNEGNIFIDLLLGAITVFLLRRKEWYFKLLAILPFAFTIASFCVVCIENSEHILIHWLPFFLRPQYHFYSLLMMALFYLAHPLTDLFLKQHAEKTGLNFESLKGSNMERYALNIISAGFVIVATIIYLVVSLLIPQDWVYWIPGIQNAAMIAGAFILLYSGKRGYNAKWFQYGSYLYYPIHLLVVFGIGMLL